MDGWKEGEVEIRNKVWYKKANQIWWKKESCKQKRVWEESVRGSDDNWREEGQRDKDKNLWRLFYGFSSDSN